MSVDGVFDKLTSFLPLRRISSTKEVAGKCAFLASDDASFITADAILVDGGGSRRGPVRRCAQQHGRDLGGLLNALSSRLAPNAAARVCDQAWALALAP